MLRSYIIEAKKKLELFFLDILSAPFYPPKNLSVKKISSIFRAYFVRGLLLHCYTCSMCNGLREFKYTRLVWNINFNDSLCASKGMHHVIEIRDACWVSMINCTSFNANIAQKCKKYKQLIIFYNFFCRLLRNSMFTFQFKPIFNCTFQKNSDK